MNQDLDQSDHDEPSAQWPEMGQLCEVRVLTRPHPALLDQDEFLRQCRFQAMRRGGPGGQHRNKVSSAVRLVHEPTGVIGEASERRDQSQNLSVAIQRLRLRLAIQYRTAGATANDTVSEQRRRWQGTNLKISESNPDHAAILTLLLDDLHRSGGQPSLVASLWQASTSSIVRFVAAVPPAFVLLNQWRVHHGRRPLKSSQ